MLLRFPPIADTSDSGQSMRMLTLSKPFGITTSTHIEGEVTRALEAIAVDIEHESDMTIYKIWPTKYSMFAPYSEVRFGRRANTWVLQLALNRLLLVPLGFFALAVIAFGIMGPITSAHLGIIFGFPLAVVTLAILESQVRLRRWWALL